MNKARVLHKLHHTKKSYSHFSHCVSEVEFADDKGKYILKGDGGKVVASCKFKFINKEIIFSDFQGDQKLKKMLRFHLVEEIYEKATVVKDSIEMFYDRSGFYLEENGEFFKLARDGDSLMKIALIHVPRELKIGKKPIVGNSV
jgi:hypothetical protein